MWDWWNMLLKQNFSKQFCRFRFSLIQVDKSSTCMHNKLLPRGFNKMATNDWQAYSPVGLSVMQENIEYILNVLYSESHSLLQAKRFELNSKLKSTCEISQGLIHPNVSHLPSYLAPAVTIMSRNCGPLLCSGLRVNRPQWHYCSSTEIYNVINVYAKFKFFFLPSSPFSIIISQVLSRLYCSSFTGSSSVELCRLCVGFMGNGVFLSLNLQWSPCGI